MCSQYKRKISPVLNDFIQHGYMKHTAARREAAEEMNAELIKNLHWPWVL